MPAETVHLLNFLSSALITLKLIADQSTCDLLLSKVLRHLELSWPDTVEDTLRPYLNAPTLVITGNHNATTKLLLVVSL